MTTKLTASDRHTLARQCLRDALHYHKRGHADLVALGRLAKEFALPVQLTDSDVKRAMVGVPGAGRERGKESGQ